MSNKPQILVFGAGCIGRGLIGELAARGGWDAVFVEARPDFVRDLRKAGRYTVRLVGRAERVTPVEGFRVLLPEHRNALAEAARQCAFAATAVGGEHLANVAESITPGLRRRATPLNLLVCENWPRADQVLRDALLKAGGRDESFSCVAASVERIVRPVPDSLDLIGESRETLLFDATRWRGALPQLEGLVLCDDLTPYYARKLFTNNAGHAVLAYEGHLVGCELLCDALDEASIRGRLESLLETAAAMLGEEYGLGRESLEDHVRVLVRHRFANRDLADTVRRVARAPLRKLGPEERMVGLLRRLQKHGLPIQPVCRTIAAALHYRDPADDGAVKLARMIRQGGARLVLEKVCGIRPEEEAHTVCLGEVEGIETG